MGKSSYSDSKMQTKNAPRTKGVGNYMNQSSQTTASVPGGAQAGMKQGKANVGSHSNPNGLQPLMGQGGGKP